MAHETFRPQFDSYLGGEQALPSSINIQDFCQNRMEEILMLTESLKESPFRGQIFQRLPKHMRRRQMSHHIKRLPRSLRSPYISSLQNDAQAKSKCPSRKYRRRPSNLLLEYNRRQRENVWLETHVWHSKRFHMTTKWGYKLGEKPCNKSVRACYRAAAQHCLLNDLSFYNCIQLMGSESQLLEGLQQCISPLCGLTFASKMYKSGSYEGNVFLYHPNRFPYGAIGRVSFLWKPMRESGEENVIWIFVHPLLHNEVIDMFRSLFNLKECSTLKSSSEESPQTAESEAKSNGETVAGWRKRKRKTNKETAKLDTRNVPFDRTPKFVGDNGSVRMTSLKDTINRFRLTGPLSLSVISAAFDVAPPPRLGGEVPSSEEKAKPEAGDSSPRKRSHSIAFGRESPDDATGVVRGKSEGPEGSEGIPRGGEKKDLWWRSFYKNDLDKKCLRNQMEFFKKLSAFNSCAALPPGMVFSVLAKDPRLTIPSQRIKSAPAAQGAETLSLSDVSPELPLSPLWEPDVRDEVSKLKVTTSEINEARSKLIVPGSDVSIFLAEEKQERIPLVLIQRTPTNGTHSHSGSNDFGLGLDVLVPAGWAMPVWLSLIYRGARTGGLREWESLALESNTLSECFPPDSRAGELDNWETHRKMRSEYFRKPPSKRHNFFKMSVRSPFFLPWECLTKDWNSFPMDPDSRGESSDGRFYVLRDRKKLRELDELVRELRKALKADGKATFGHSFGEEEMNCLVEVSVESLGKGIPGDFAMLCVPDPEDSVDSEDKDGPVEEMRRDSNAVARKSLRRDHAKKLKSLRRKRRKEKMKEKAAATRDPPSSDADGRNDSDKGKFSSEDSVRTFNEEMENYWLNEPKDISSVIDSSSRMIFGYVVRGGYSYARARGLGLGYVALKGLLFFLKTCHEAGKHPRILFRNTTSLEYRIGKINICTN